MLLGALGVCAGSLFLAAGLWYADRVVGELPRVAVGATLDEVAVEDDERSTVPRNFLIVGADSVSTLPEDDPLRADRSDIQLLTDTMMIARINPATEEAHLLSIPRDLFVPIAGAGYKERINAALAIGGSETLIRSIQDELGIPIHHYVEADFNGFRKVVEALDGVPLYIPFPMRDARSGFVQTEPGCHLLAPDDALKYVRSRAMEGLIDGDVGWEYLDLTPDLGRISRQQGFMEAALQRAIAKGGLRNPQASLDLLDSAIDAVTLDDIISRRDLLDLGTQFETFQSGSLQTYTLPVFDADVGTDDAPKNVLILATTDAQPILDVFRGDGSAADAAARVRVRVLNGTGESGLASQVGLDLSTIGFEVVHRGDAASFDNSDSIVRYAAGREVAAQVIADALVGQGADVAVRQIEADDLDDAEIEVVVGETFVAVDVRVDLQPLLDTDTDAADEETSAGVGAEVDDEAGADVSEPAPEATPLPACA